MELQLLNCLDNDNVIGKTYTVIDTLDIKLKSNVNIQSPTLILTKKPTINYDEVNYAKLLERFYFVTSFQQGKTNFITLNLKEDVLETFKDDILNGTAIITRSQKPTYDTDGLTSDSRTETDLFNSDTTLEDVESYILNTIGG